MRFKYKNHLQYHQKRHPTDDNPLPYSCKYCQEHFASRAEQLAHSNTIHVNNFEIFSIESLTQFERIILITVGR